MNSLNEIVAALRTAHGYVGFENDFSIHVDPLGKRASDVGRGGNRLGIDGRYKVGPWCRELVESGDLTGHRSNRRGKQTYSEQCS